MSELVKPKPTIVLTKAWGGPGWGKHDTETRTKVPGRNPLPNQPPPHLEYSTCPAKNERSSKIVRSLIPSLHTSFTILTHVISVL